MPRRARPDSPPPAPADARDGGAGSLDGGRAVAPPARRPRRADDRPASHREGDVYATGTYEHV
jgi:hypothetical protein